MIKGKDLDDLQELKIYKSDLHIPSTRQFTIYKYLNPKSGRFLTLLSCDFCDKCFKKWHNFFDHLRIHTEERPYKCPYGE